VDVTIRKQILELIDGLREEIGMAVILITHDLGDIAGSADRVAVMYAGRVVEVADVTALFGGPRHASQPSRPGARWCWTRDCCAGSTCSRDRLWLRSRTSSTAAGTGFAGR
jgi:ABC-type sulfate/molybdate transport systems ATPase subunit